MKLTKLTASAIMALSLASVSLEAQSLKNVQAPAEFPPASFAGKQYVDSRGCVFIRAGIGGETTWVPRVTRSRNLICGQKPTFEGQQVAETAKPAAPKVVELTLDTPTVEEAAPTARKPAPARGVTAPKRAPEQVAAAPVVAKPAPSPAPKPRVAAAEPKPKPARVARAAAPKPSARVSNPTVYRSTQNTPKATPRKVVKPLNLPVRVVRAAPVTATQPKVRTVTPVRAPAAVVAAAPACQGASAISSRYINNGSRHPVRCGPQQVSVTSSRAASVGKVAAGQEVSRSVASAAPRVATRQTVSSTQRVVPRHVYVDRQNTANVRVPKGYQSVWQDDRLNKQRAEQTLAGDSRMKLIWTNTVPRRLINQQTGRDMTARLPLVYPFISYAKQERELGKVTLVKRNGQLVKRIKRNTRAKAVVQAKPRQAAKPKATTRAKLAVPTQQKAVKGRYVQVGMFGVPSNAQRAAARLKAAGLPARIGRITRKGKAYQLVMAGPFSSNAGLSSALRVARAQGFSDAYIRR